MCQVLRKSMGKREKRQGNEKASIGKRERK